jgi:hypothetical protein
MEAAGGDAVAPDMHEAAPHDPVEIDPRAVERARAQRLPLRDRLGRGVEAVRRVGGGAPEAAVDHRLEARAVGHQPAAVADRLDGGAERAGGGVDHPVGDGEMRLRRRPAGGGREGEGEDAGEHGPEGAACGGAAGGAGRGGSADGHRGRG